MSVPQDAPRDPQVTLTRPSNDLDLACGIIRHIGTKVIAYNPRRRCGRRRVGVSDLAPVSSWGDEDTIEQGPGVRIVRGEDEEERP